MARKKKQFAFQIALQPHELPKISRHSIRQTGGGWKLNPFEYLGKTYRIVGTRIVDDDGNALAEPEHSILCEETREYKWKSETFLKSVAKRPKK